MQTDLLMTHAHHLVALAREEQHGVLARRTLLLPCLGPTAVPYNNSAIPTVWWEHKEAQGISVTSGATAKAPSVILHRLAE